MPVQSKNKWNRTLRFSWGHILASLALIFILYVVFMGGVYLKRGNFLGAGIYALINIAVLFATFIGAQYCKAAERKFGRYIILERILLVLSVVAFGFTCFSGRYNQFFGVVRTHNVIEKDFSTAIDNTKEIFTEYEKYANDRIAAYEQNLGNFDKSTKDAYLKTLKLQLLSENEEKLKSRVRKWVDENKDATVWNIFLIGNIDNITDRVDEWNNALIKWSNPILTCEGVGSYSFSKKMYYASDIKGKLDNVALECMNKKKLQFNTFWTALILFIMLLLPYLLQDRNTKAVGFVSLIPKTGSKGTDGEVGENDGNWFTWAFSEIKGMFHRSDKVKDAVDDDGTDSWSDEKPEVMNEPTSTFDDDDLYSGEF